ncbi:hypothetical protein [Burkholderia sp. BCC0405]|uniref:hypothetical protein n=1 Tax=Burkholderia sp. BCC0405 TaxID=2676298 RepID=UPI00158F0F88|nr:hypothetical protein [Burkholderia sp. BCC0405]
MNVVNDGKRIAQSEDDHIKELVYKWVGWHRSRKLFAPPVPQSILARIGEPPGRDHGNGGPDAELSAAASYFNLALLAMPEGKPKQAFYLLYFHQVRPAKLIMDALEMEKSQFYDMVKKFRKDTYRAYQRMLCQ